MTMTVDHDEVLMTGENSFIRLSEDGGETLSERLSHWRVLWCPAGPGHALFMQGRLSDDRVRIYSDNIAVARWLQKTIESVLFAPFADATIPVLPAQFARYGDPRSSAVELIESDDDLVRMTWYDCMDAFVMNAPPGTDGRPIGVYTTFFPARGAQLSVNGRIADGSVTLGDRGGRDFSSCVLAWSETWVRPRAG
jgi:hypothetical protein